MKPKYTNLDRAIHKSKQVNWDKTLWLGKLTPSEILSLIGVGVIPKNTEEVSWAKFDAKKGNSTPRYFWFYPNGLVMNKEK